MIQKIEIIKNIGNYEDYVASGDVTLKRMNLIYAENGAGKTTLARILHSMSVNNPIVISQRKRIGAITASEVCIKDESGQLNYNGIKWNRNKPNVTVFDTHFVSENVYTGFQISSDHRKHLYKFVLGDTGVDIAKKIERAKQLIESKNNEIVGLTNQIQIASKCQDVEKVYNLSPLADIDTLIDAKKKELKVAQNNNVILKQSTSPLFPEIPFSLDVEYLKRILSISINGIGKEYLDIVKSHLDKLKSNGIEKSAQWVYTGFQTINSLGKNECPFCGNSIEGIKLIEGYNQYFSEKYINAVREAKVLKERLSSINIELYINQVISANKQFEELNNFWANYITIESEKLVFDYNFDTLCGRLQSLKDAVDTKFANPIDEVSTIVADECVTELQTLSEKIRAINEYALLYNTRILELRTKIRKIEDVTKELNKLELNKERFQAPLINKCFMYGLANNHLKRLQKINKLFQVEQKTESNRVFEQYGQKINYYLRDVFSTKFQILEIKDGGIKGRAKEANLSYTLTFNGTPIKQEGESNTSFKNILSEGDKNTIAFSFFLAKLTTESNLPNQIVVFDDPLTSLDLNRRNATIHQLVLLYQHSEQTIVLSHNLHFLIELNSRSLIKTCDKKSLQIININGKSSIREHQIKKEWIDNYQRALDSMENFLSNPLTDNQENAINSIRISLETFIKLKYCRYIPDPDQTFGNIVSNLQKSPCVFINPNKVEVIDKLNQLVAISWRGHHGSIEERYIYSEVNLTMAEAQQYINMTLALLSHEL
ncbi:MAG: AAA family ATPase [Bacteroides sp.]|nr:AAA family ATPase [Bacteroides sp.]